MSKNRIFMDSSLDDDSPALFSYMIKIDLPQETVKFIRECEKEHKIIGIFYDGESELKLMTGK